MNLEELLELINELERREHEEAQKQLIRRIARQIVEREKRRRQLQDNLAQFLKEAQENKKTMVNLAKAKAVLKQLKG